MSPTGDKKRHYGDGLYQEAARILDRSEGDLRNMKSMADRFELSWRHDKLSWWHHYEVSSIKKIVTNKNGKLELSNEPGMEAISSCP